MTMTEKFKGIVKNRTLDNIIHKLSPEDIFYSPNAVEYFTDKNHFVAKKRNVKYWEVFMIKGV